MKFTECFERAAEIIAETKQFPGQSVPGLWTLNEHHHVPAVLISIIIANALASAAKDCDETFDFLLDRYMKIMADQPMEVRGAPDQIARSLLLRAAEINRDLTATAHRRLCDAARDALDLLHSNPSAQDVCARLRRALSDSRCHDEVSAHQGKVAPPAS